MIYKNIKNYLIFLFFVSCVTRDRIIKREVHPNHKNPNVGSEMSSQKK